ncbi:hypothetical protein INT48_000611 [Thamnidium elegans]|uniref:Uncharacterized protein n=1 Tax=Thamnidium elegans TaxID=101142 RepID=A0A8H7SJI6_9FUNG|nr:hypothetical protein INT48_000611 [Thamnidium elegans]
MSMTKEEAACSIYGLEVTTENAKQCLEYLESAGLVPIGFKGFNSSLKRKEIEEKESESSFEVSVSQSKRILLNSLCHLSQLLAVCDLTFGAERKRYMNVVLLGKTFPTLKNSEKSSEPPRQQQQQLDMPDPI